jgi:hypothetical protein
LHRINFHPARAGLLFGHASARQSGPNHRQLHDSRRAAGRNAWFKGVIAPNGVPCCDISDGHRTDYNFRDGAYWVPIEGQWMQVPAHAIIRDRGNPIGEAVVWYVHHRGSIVISCFVRADAV